MVLLLEQLPSLACSVYSKPIIWKKDGDRGIVSGNVHGDTSASCPAGEPTVSLKRNAAVGKAPIQKIFLAYPCCFLKDFPIVSHCECALF